MKRIAGPGAGITIHFSNINPKNIEITDMSGLTITDESLITGTVKCKVDCTVDLSDVSSYEYTAGDFDDVPAVITEIEFDEYDGIDPRYWINWDDETVWIDDVLEDEREEYPIEDKDKIIQECKQRNIEYYKTQDGLDDIKDIIYDYLSDYPKTSFVYGGGYIYSAYNGQFASTEDEYFTGYITNEKIIKFIDEAVQGENIVTEYWVVNGDDIIECDSAEEAEQVAKEKGGIPMVSEYWVDIYGGIIGDVDSYRL